MSALLPNVSRAATHPLPKSWRIWHS